jgi:hypothetical protein
MKFTWDCEKLSEFNTVAGVVLLSSKIMIGPIGSTKRVELHMLTATHVRVTCFSSAIKMI